MPFVNVKLVEGVFTTVELDKIADTLIHFGFYFFIADRQGVFLRLEHQCFLDEHIIQYGALVYPFYLLSVIVALHIGNGGGQFRFQDDLIAYDAGNLIGNYFFLGEA